MNFFFRTDTLNINDLISKYDPKVTKGKFRIVTNSLENPDDQKRRKLKSFPIKG
ncbi:hypothetical protein LEP1GSC005_3674 [Leptospira santarosai str. ST188]|uniref:Uncharacterized protein n=2 Tax=Leptospira santarosai TaxID=28183 RepID=M6UL71_9LEPT|nr:hypothetical protein LEP1GSC179_3696 [Leptospira santarosai str. MOR084]EMF90796.1 hypothetical protein LEP1GSC005_3674 [Leptospira santarosai str. ST188]EMO16016.1 hypothetical protein LEP1GSC165_3016 [Leptospira santarosai str. CBC523]EMO43526.1 hypothetical protein LEP1GSC187_3059 [Leptospira santarosai str. ZUN179]EMO70834.1 hypothetical protein LEP1GSC130_1300 [Leptospira santarosai str. 200403458]EMO98834.1 hypothetical protein LEP1GSC120_2207 [Leptospira santarosai str. 200702252]